MVCPICENLGKKIFSGKIMKKYMIQYYQCNLCGFVYTESPYWLDEAYEDSITNVDTGIMERTVDNAVITNTLINFFFDDKGTFLDYGGGYGIFTRMMRDMGYNWTWYDKYSANFVARGFEYNGKDNILLLTAFELFEHFEKPISEIEHLLSISESILFSTIIYDTELAYKEFNEWWYYVPETGQHISFYSQKTLEYIAGKFNLYYYKINRGMHLFSKKQLNYIKLKILLSTKLAENARQFYYWRQRKKSLASIDMRTIINMRNLHNLDL